MNTEKNNSNNHRVELLAPAGELDSFYGAIMAGADAVYLAGEKFGARAYAENFTSEKLVECIQYAHLHKRKVYLTVNTLLKNDEISELYDYIYPFYEAGLDAVIVQDLGVLKYLRLAFPELEIHVSTQMTICSGYGASQLKELGASRIVPARELSLSEILQMKAQANIEIETFIHGAMCYCYSGQCLFSSILGGRSGNRGRCAQPCRLPYSVKTDNQTSREVYPLSLKDMCTIEHIPEFIEAGIDSFKIEGRMKKPEYAAGVTDIYRRAIDNYYQLRERYDAAKAKENYKINPLDMKHLFSLYIRSDIQDGYYFKHNGKEMVTLSSPSYVSGEEDLLAKIRNQFISGVQKLPVTVLAEFKIGLPAKLRLTYQDLEVTVYGEKVQEAMKQPVTEVNIRKQLSKFGDTFFYADRIDVSMDENIFCSLKSINELRRDGIKKVLELVTNPGMSKRFASSSPTLQKVPGLKNASHGYAISVNDIDQLQAVHEFLSKKECDTLFRIYLPMDSILEHTSDVLPICYELSGKCQLWISLPYIFRRKDEKYMEQLKDILDEAPVFAGILVRSMDEIGYLSAQDDWNLPLRADAGLYSWNAYAIEQLTPYVEGFCLPYELNHREQVNLINITSNQTYEKVIYGRIPMMVTANCVLKTMQSCSAFSANKVALIDRYKKEFPVLRNCNYCYNIIYNSVPLSLPQSRSHDGGSVDCRIDFTIEPKKETLDILSYFFDELNSGAHKAPYGEYTTGHEKRGVE